MIISSIHHFVASEFGLIIRGGISSKYSCITDNFILGEGIVEAHKLEKDIAIYPRVILESSIINDELYEIITRHYRDNDLDFISKDCDGYYFVNYLALLQYIPPMIGKAFKKEIERLGEEKYMFKLKRDVLEKYKEIVINGLKTTNEKVRIKYNWLDNYLKRVCLNKDFLENIKLELGE